MVELELVGLSEDGTQVVLADAAGDEFAVPADERLRALLRDHRVRTRQWEISMESALRPRDIQARIRAGADPEAVAEVAQVPVDKIMGYAVPVIAERQHIAERAQRSAVRRKHPEGPGRLLGDAVAERLRARNLDPDSCRWDAWRRDDGRWTVCARFHDEGSERRGMFVFDALSRYVLPDDDDARWLVGERVPDTERPEHPERGTDRTAGRRLSAVASEYDAMLFDDEEATGGLSSGLTAVADVLGDQPVAEPDHPEQPAHASTHRATAHHRSAGEPAAHAATAAGEVSPEASREADGEADAGADAEADAGEPVARAAAAGESRPRRTQQPKPEKRGRRSRGRASVPSWDEIMFGEPKA